MSASAATYTGTGRQLYHSNSTRQNKRYSCRGQNIKEEREHAISINDSDSEHEIEVYNINPTRKFKLSMFYCKHNNLKYQTY